MPEEVTVPEWIRAISRHITTIVLFFTVIWWLAAPRAEEFVRKAVNVRISKVEMKVDDVGVQLNEIINRLEKIEGQTSGNTNETDTGSPKD